MAECHIEIRRDPDRFVDRYVEDVRTKVLPSRHHHLPTAHLTCQEVLYYVEVSTENTMVVHRDSKDGPVVATTEACQEKLGSSKIKMAGSDTTITLAHTARAFSIGSPKTAFTVDGKEYEWKGYNTLVEKKTGRLVAQYSPVDKDDLYGNLVFAKGDQFRTDMIVLSTLVLQQRAAARVRAVHLDTFILN